MESVVSIAEAVNSGSTTAREDKGRSTLRFHIR